MDLDYESAHPEQVQQVLQTVLSFDRSFRDSGKKYELHEKILKPKLELLDNAKII